MLILSLTMSFFSSAREPVEDTVDWVIEKHKEARIEQELFVLKQNRIAEKIGICNLPRTCEGIWNYKLTL